MFLNYNKITNSKLLLGAIALAVLSTAACADDRVIEDTLIYKDPTVAQAGQWVGGASLDYFNVNENASGPIQNFSYSQTGLSAFAGYGDVTVMASYRSGTANLTENNGANLSVKLTNDEIDVRWLLHDLKTSFFVPYVLAGYENGTEDEGSAGTITITEPLVGVGVIIPVNEAVGFRVDGRYAATSASMPDGSTLTYGTQQETATMYYNIAKNASLQVGVRNQSGNGISETGVYAMLGFHN